MNEPSHLDSPSSAPSELQNPPDFQGVGSGFATYFVLFHPLPPVALFLLSPWYVVRASNLGNRILHHISNSLQAHLPLGCLNHPRTNIFQLDRTSSGRYSDSDIFFIREDILDLLVIWIPTVSPLPIAKMSKMENKSFLRLVKAL